MARKPGAQQDSTSQVDVEFVARLKELATKAGSATALAKAAGLSVSGFQRYLNGGDPGRSALIAIARAARTRLEWLATGEGPRCLDDDGPAGSAHADGVWEEFDLVPLYDAVVSAGAGSVVTGDERPLAQMAFRKYWLSKLGLRAADLVMIRARGDSMEPAIRDGDTLLLDTSRNTPEGGYIYVVRVNDELRAKRLQRLMDGSVRVSSDNKVYADEVIDVSDLEHLHILGRVVWKGGLI